MNSLLHLILLIHTGIDSPITSVANAATMTILALYTSQPHIFYNTEI